MTSEQFDLHPTDKHIRTSRRSMLKLAAAGAIVAGGSFADLAPTTAAPSGSAGAGIGRQQKMDTLTIGQPAPFQFLDPQRTYLSSESSMHQSIFDTLVSFDADAQFVPALSTEWESTSDTDWVFKLREGVTFHDGTPFDAEAVRYNVERITQPGFQDWAFMEPVSHAEVVDPMTVKIVTKALLPTLPNLLAQFFIVSPTAMDAGVDAFTDHPIGSGPYKFVDWQPDDHVRVEANADYWGGAPAIPDVIWRVLPEASTRIAALQNGEIQILKDLPSDQFDMIGGTDGLAALEVRSLRTPYLRFFPESPQGGGEPFSDIRVRQAFNYAINVDSIIENLLGGHAERAATLMTPDIFGFAQDVAPFAYDLEKAKALMADAGYEDGFEITFDTWSSGPAPKPVELAQAVAADLAKINVKATVQPVELGTALQQQNERTIAPFGLWSWGGNGFDGDTKFWGVFHPDSSACFLTDDTLVGMIDQQRGSLDPAVREPILAEMQQYVVDQAFIVSLFAQMDTYGSSNSIEWTPRHDEMVLPYAVTPVE